jgi:hypothetical protein
MRLITKERADPTWAPTGNDDWWADFFQARYDADMAITDSLVDKSNRWNREGRVRFWRVPGRTLPDVIDGIHNGSPRLAMPPSPPPWPRTPAC